jgi:hypothetical protein
MSNVVQFSITGDTNAEQVAGRAKAAVSGLDKQMEGIGKKFGSSFKDIFLSFLGPMALISAAMAFIGKMISDNQKKQEDANKAAIEGTNALMSAEDKYWANKRNNEKEKEKTVEEAETEREAVTKSFLDTDPRGKAIQQRRQTGTLADLFLTNALSKNKAIQDEVQILIAEDIKNNPAAGANLKDSTFQGPQGFSNVIGVGANPVLENMTRQTDIQQAILDFIRTPGAKTGITDVDFTKQPIDIRTAT